MPNKSKKMMRLVNLLLMLTILVAVPLQSVSGVAFAASTTSSSTTSDESIDDWMPDKTLQDIVLDALKDSGCSVNTGTRSDLTLSEITPAMLADLRYLNTGAGKTTHVTGITDLTGLQYATGLAQVNFSGSTIVKFSGDWSIFDSLDNTSDLGTIDANSDMDLDLQDLSKLLSTTTATWKINDNKVGMTNISEVPNNKKGTAITKLTPGENMTYDSDLSSMKAYIPLSDWYKGFVTSDGTFAYGSAVSTYPTLPNGVTLDMPNHRFVVDLNVCGGHEVTIPSFAIKDVSNDGKTTYYNEGNTLNAVMPMSSVPVDTDQTAEVPSRTNPTGSINTATFGFGNATDAQLTINSGDLTSDDITFSPDLAENKINFTLTSSGEQKLRAGDLTSDITIATSDASVKLTLKLAEPLDTWMPSTALQTALTDAGVKELTKANLAKFTGPLNLTGVSDLTGLEYAKDLGSLNLNTCDLYGDKLGQTTNSQVLSKLTGLTSLEIDSSQLGGSLADWGLEGEPNLANITAKSDNLTNPGTSDYADDGNLKSLDLSDNALNEDVSQVVGTWPKLTSIHLQDNQLTGSLPSFADNPALEQLYLSNNQLTGPIPDSYGSLPALDDLQLDKNKLSGSLPTALTKEAALTVLHLNNNQFTGEIPSLAQLQNLSSVNLSANQFSGTLPDLGASSALKQVYLSSNQLTGTIPDSYGKLPALSELQLHDNSLSGALPAALGNDTALTSLYLNGNQFTGSIPEAWSALGSLKTLNLSTNKLDGTLNKVAFSSLEDANLNFNQFSGSLPEAWFTSKLTSFQATNNQFSGDLPDLSKADHLAKMLYGANKITSGTTLAGAAGNYQTWSIQDPDWQTSSDGKMTLDLSKYYHGEQGQIDAQGNPDYSHIGISDAQIVGVSSSDVKLDKSNPSDPLLTIDSTSAAVGNLTFNLCDQAGKDATYNSNMPDDSDMNYMTTITVPMWSEFGITTGTGDQIDFGSPKVGTGVVPATNFKLGVSSTNALGKSYQLMMAQTRALTSDGGYTLPLYYGNGQHQTLLTSAAQSIYDYQPTTNDGTETIVGDSSDSTKGNLQTDIPSTTHTGTYTGDITYTLASAPADDSTTSATNSDAGQVTPATLSLISPTIPATDLTVEQQATLTKLQTNMTKFMPTLDDGTGVLYSGYKAVYSGTDTKDGTREELTETSGFWLLALAMSGDETTFDTAMNGVKARFYDSSTGTFNWQALGEDHTVTQGSASIDDLRIIQALLIMNQKHPNNDRAALINELIDGFTKHDLNDYYQMIDGYSTANGQEKTIRLDYLDLATLKAIYEAKGLGTTAGTPGGTAYQQQLKLIKDSYISDKLPMFATYYDYSTGNYQVHGDTADDQLNITDGLLTMLNLAKVGELPQTSLNWLLQHTTTDEKIYNNYNLADGTAADGNDAPSNYAYVAQIAVALSNDPSLHSQAVTLYSQALAKLNEATTDSGLPELDGSAQAGGESYAFNDLNMLLAYNSVAFGTTSSGE